MRQIQGRETIFARFFGDIAIVAFPVDGDDRIPVDNGDHLVFREQQPVCFLQILNRILLCDQTRPVLAPLAQPAFAVKFVQPDMGMAIDKCSWKKRPQHGFIILPVIRLDIQQRHTDPLSFLLLRLFYHAGHRKQLQIHNLRVQNTRFSCRNHSILEEFPCFSVCGHPKRSSLAISLEVCYDEKEKRVTV